MEKIIFGIVGPTATGKTKIALELAKKFPIEIISCDSMQIYKDMDIGTAKPDKAILEKIPHHMINITDVEKEFSVADYTKMARKITEDILNRKKIPFIVGGSGLYYNGYIDGIFPEVGKDTEFRKDMQDIAKSEGNEKLHSKLKTIDPKAGEKIHPNDIRRIIRALEVYHITGKTITEKKKEKISLKELGFNLNIYAIKFSRDVLYNYINKRVDSLIDNGLVDEARKLKENKKLSMTARMAIGYKEIYSYLDGNETLEQAIDNIKQYTRNYARRQITWFKKRKEVEWIELKSNEEWEKATDRISLKLKNKIKT